jgi:glutamate dehydrogenase
VFGLPDYWARVEALDNLVPTAAQCALFLESRRLLDRAARWVLTSRGGTVDVEREIEALRDEVQRVVPRVPDLLVGVEKERLEARTGELVALGAPRELARETAALLDAYGLLDVVEVAHATETPAEDVAEIYFTLSERYEVDLMLSRITQLPRDDRWSALARAALRSDLYGALRDMTRRVVVTTDVALDPFARITQWEELQSEGLARARATLDEITSLDQFDLATLSVALRTIRTLVHQGSSAT